MAVILGRSRRAHSRRALGFPLDPPPRPLVVRPPERPTSQGGFAACPLRFAQGAATPPWTPGLSPRGPLLRSVPRARGDSQLVRFASLRGLLLPPGPPYEPDASGTVIRRATCRALEAATASSIT